MPEEVLLVEDSPTDALIAADALEVGGFRVESASRLTDALDRLKSRRFHLVFLDLGLPDSNGLETLRALRTQSRGAAVVVLTGRDDDDLALRALREGADDYLVKGAGDGSQLRRAARYAIERAQANERLHEAEERFRLMVEGAKDHAIMMLDPDGRVVTWNAGAERFLGYSADEIVGQDYARFFRAEDIAKGVPDLELRQAVAAGRHVSEGWRVRKDGREFWANGGITALYHDDGSLRGFAKITRDLTERKQTEERLAASERLFHQLADAMPQIVWAAGPDGRADYHNLRWHEYTGLAREGTPDDGWRPIVHPDDQTGLADEWSRALAASETFQTEARLRHAASGKFRWHLVRALPIRDEAGRVTRWIGTSTDVEDLKRAEQSLRSSEELFRGAFEFTNLPTVVTDLQNRFVRVNAAFVQMFGYTEAELLTLSIADLTHSDDMVDTLARRQTLLAGEARSFEAERRLFRKDGGLIQALVNVSLVRDANGEPQYYVGQVQDVTERKRAEEGLRLRDRAIHAVTQGILITDAQQPENPIIFASPGFERITGYSFSEVLGRNCRLLQGPESDPGAIAQFREAIRRGQACGVEVLNYRKDGSTFWNAVSISPVRGQDGTVTHFVGVQTDVTERRRLEEQLRQSQKMEAIGSLAGGVAHDFNNLLTVINGYSEIIEGQLPADSPVRGLAREIGEAGRRAASLTRQLLAFSRKQVLESKVLNLNTVVSDTARMLRRLIGEDVELSTGLDPALGRVKADPGQVEQVLINLAVNARDAMPRGGKLTVETANVELDEQYTRAIEDLRPGHYVLLAVTDTGAGMDERTKARIFEPFFTTKPPGKGTGLGLATVFGIVKQSGGHVAVYSEVDRGTAIKVYLPRFDRPNEPGRSGEPAASPPRGTETILLVEDEPALLNLSRLILRGQGYTVLEARGGEEALRIARNHDGPLHLLVTDVVMPGLSGREVAEGVCAIKPGTKVLFVSGYTDDAVVRHGILQAEAHFLQKPFTPASLSLKVREILQSK